jgi:hypothetical protein
MWEFLQQILLTQNNKLIKLSYEFWYEFREQAMSKITDLA